MTFTGGEQIDASDSDIVVIVGPNNAGKSRSLQEVFQLLVNQPGFQRRREDYLAVEQIDLAKVSNADEVTAWMIANRHTHLQRDGSGQDIQFVRTVGAAGDFRMTQLEGLWSAGPGFGELGLHLARSLTATERLSLFGGSAQRLTRGTPPDAPIHRLATDENLRDEFSMALFEAFGWHVVIDGWNPQLTVYVSDAPQSDFRASSDTGLAPVEIEERFSGMRQLAEQSDGVRSFAGILLTLFTTPFPVLLIDEPEAFLHPPQARLLGRNLRRLRRDGQVVIATHDLDILVGLLTDGGEPDGSRVRVIRLERDGEVVHAHAMAPDEVMSLWKDPTFRYSRALDGLFHDGVAVVEGDTDCRFYGAVASIVSPGPASMEPAIDVQEVATTGAATARPADVMFLPSGGKQRMPRLVRALKRARVPVQVIADFDVLNDEAILLGICDALGLASSAREEVKRDRQLIDDHVRGGAARRTRLRFETEASEVLKEVELEATLGKAVLRRLAELLGPIGGWAKAKEIGAAAVPPGDATSRLLGLLDTLRSAGLHVVPGGAVESFVKEVGGTSTSWVIEVIDRGLVDRAVGAHDFVRELLSTFEPIRSSTTRPQ